MALEMEYSTDFAVRMKLYLPTPSLAQVIQFGARRKRQNFKVYFKHSKDISSLF